MKDRDRTLMELALRAIADDYENFERIVQDVASWAAERGITADRQATLRALERLINDGYAQAYVLSGGPPGTAEAVNYSAARLDELWFYLTPNGEQLVRQLQEQWS